MPAGARFFKKNESQKALNHVLTFQNAGARRELSIDVLYVTRASICVELWPFYCSKRILVPMSYIKLIYIYILLLLLYYIISYYIILYHIILYYIILYYDILYHIILYYIISYYIILYHIILYYIIYKLSNYMGKRYLRIRECQFLKSA